MEKVISQPEKRPKKNKRVVGKKRIKIKINTVGNLEVLHKKWGEK